MRSVFAIVVALFLVGCSDCSDSVVAIQYCDRDDDCSDGALCLGGECTDPGESWVGNGADADRSSGDNDGSGPGVGGGGMSTADSGRLPADGVADAGRFDELPLCNADEHPYCDGGECVGTVCVGDCQQHTECAPGQTCRGLQPGEFECIDAWTCGPGGSGMATSGSCFVRWEDCDTGIDYGLSCKVIDGEAEPPYEMADVRVLCTCLADGVAGNQFEWVGLACVPTHTLSEKFVNTKCGWRLPIPGSQ